MSAPVPLHNIHDIPPVGSSGSTTQAAEKRLLLGWNESPLAPSRLAMEAFEKRGHSLNRYPDSSYRELREAIGTRFSCDPGKTVVSCGSEALINMIICGYCGPGDEVLYSRYEFLMVVRAARLCGATPVEVQHSGWQVDVDAMLTAITDKTKLVFIANPNKTQRAPTSQTVRSVGCTQAFQSMCSSFSIPSMPNTSRKTTTSPESRWRMSSPTS